MVVSLIAVMYGAGISNLWLEFLFAGILSLPGFEWREFVRYAAIVTVYVTVLVLGLLLLFYPTSSPSRARSARGGPQHIITGTMNEEL